MAWLINVNRPSHYYLMDYIMSKLDEHTGHTSGFGKGGRGAYGYDVNGYGNGGELIHGYGCGSGDGEEEINKNIFYGGGCGSGVGNISGFGIGWGKL